MTAFNFDATKVEPDQGRVGALPKGWYKTMVEKTELKPTTNGTGQLIAVQFGVVDGPHKGSKFFNNFNVINESEKAVEIGHKQLSALCYAVNVLNMSDTDQLKNIPFFTRLKYVPAEMDPQDQTKVKYEEKNEPTAYRNINDQAAIEAISKQGAAPSTQAAPAAPKAPPSPPAQQQWAQNAQQPMAPQQPMQQPMQQQAPQQWQQPAQPMQQQAPQQFQQAPAQPQPWQQPANAQPWQDPNAGQQQFQQAPQLAPQQQFQQPVQQQAPAVDGNIPPPWAQPQQ